uniref:Uncharacterized protein n=1 Tax=Timema bartmani TaxID=61472 RepID=A0A7R9F9J4_9NEOP|nr:unnamed protein product [Timema bartmani]
MQVSTVDLIELDPTKVFLLYSRDCPEFMKVMSSLNQFLEKYNIKPKDQNQDPTKDCPGQTKEERPDSYRFTAIKSERLHISVKPKKIRILDQPIDY